MGLISWLFWTAVSGLVVGALGRFALPGPNPMSLGMTMLVGIGGAFVGGLVWAALGGPGVALLLLLEVAAAAGIIYLLERKRPGSQTLR